jgi:hypothetical protein
VSNAAEFQKAYREQPPAPGLVLTFLRLLADGIFIRAIATLTEDATEPHQDLGAPTRVRSPLPRDMQKNHFFEGLGPLPSAIRVSQETTVF